MLAPTLSLALAYDINGYCGVTARSADGTLVTSVDLGSKFEQVQVQPPKVSIFDVLENRRVVRGRRAPQGGCQLGTCQMHNLATTLYHLSKTSGKDHSKDTYDPKGYGR
ncbi:hypothetical protein NHX12_025480 [Muraenolepis orangiensis]|uniref:Uncharacterized protein n=1 Tax=Muraenolepis orangiensis TaxID=630683 RepID=A0A9Q0EMT7_9TELE|nr:hypothetical protein NHX12_025480 [Muraenolepis orangiensis]